MKRILPTIISLIILGTILAIIFVYIISPVISLFGSIDKEISAAIIATSGTIFVSILTLIVSKQLEKKREIEQIIRDKKIPIYEDFMMSMFKFLNQQASLRRNQADNPSTTQLESATNQEMQTFFQEFTPKLIVWGTDEVVSNWSSFRQKSLAPQTATASRTREESIRMLLDFEKLLLSIRRDLGHANTKLKDGDLLRTFINDVPNELDM